MLTCEGHKMFEGVATVTPMNDTIVPFDITGTWLYEPVGNIWYVNGRSFDASIISNIREKK